MNSNLKHENNLSNKRPDGSKQYYNMRKGRWETEKEIIRTQRKEAIIDNITVVMKGMLAIIAGILGFCLVFSPVIISVCFAICLNAPLAYFGLFGLLFTIPLGWYIYIEGIRDAWSD